MADKLPYNGQFPFREDENDFHISRAVAIQEYAQLEQAQCMLLRHLTGVSSEAAAIIFFRVNSARSRIAMLEKLKRLKHGKDKNLAFNSAMSAIGQLDQRRNQIVHWTQDRLICTQDEEPKIYTRARLIPPNFWGFVEDEPDAAITYSDLIEFAYECDFWSRALNCLVMTWDGVQSNKELLAALELPLHYPPQAAHPLFRKRPEPKEPHPPSRA